jgi:hypothetical protein
MAELSDIGVEPEAISRKGARIVFNRGLSNRRPSVFPFEDIDAQSLIHGVPAGTLEKAQEGGLIDVPK